MTEGRMYCEIYRCEMSVATCIARQKNARDRKSQRLNKPGALDINCQNCKQGKEIMEKHGDRSVGQTFQSAINQQTGMSAPQKDSRQEKIETQVCKEKDCEHGGKPQPIDEFKTHPRFGTRFQMCNSCLSKKLRAGQQKRQKERLLKDPGKTKTEESQVKKPPPPGYITSPPVKDQPEKQPEFKDHFKGHSDIYEYLIDLAKAELRTPVNQMLYILRDFFEQTESEKL